MTVKYKLQVVGYGIGIVVTLSVWASWLWWMGYHRGQSEMLRQIQMLAPETTQKL